MLGGGERVLDPRVCSKTHLPHNDVFVLFFVLVNCVVAYFCLEYEYEYQQYHY